MRRLFGSAKEPPKAAAPAPSLQEASAKIDLQVQELEGKIVKADEELKKYIGQGNNPTAKQRAMQVMKRKKMYEQQRDQLLGTQFNVEALAFQQEQAEITCVAVEAMQAGTQTLKQQQQKVNMASVDQLTDDMAEITDEMQAIQEALAQNTGLGTGAIDESELDAEYAKLEEEMALSKLIGGASSSAGPEGIAAPAGEAAPLPAATQALAQPAAEAVPAAPPS
mmetsp:Transcript_7078/g.17553  ORF Transcript_7078/g.17553 Transcript_7078/m.17553 type:complete len:223 (+) Transcript_7078:56-724(+)